MSYASEVLADSPRAYYRLNEASGLAQDSSGNGNHATSTGAGGTATYSVSGPIASDPTDTAISFIAGGHFAVPDHATLDMGDVYTIEAWCKIGSDGSTNRVIVSKNVGGYLMLFNGDTIRMQVHSVAWISIATAITDGNWHHYVCTKNGANTKIYIDGVKVYDAAPGATTGNTASPLYIGSLEGAAGWWFVGGIDEVALYPTELSGARILAHFQAAAAAPGVSTPSVGIFTVSGLVGAIGGATTYHGEVLADGPVAYYRMQEASGLIQDSSGNANHATAASGAVGYGQVGPITAEPADKAIRFDGDTFTAPHHASLNVGDMFTFECWIKRAAISSYQVLGTKAGTNTWGVYLHASTNVIRLYNSGVGANIAESSVAITDTTTWHHIVVTKNGAAVKIYLDGVDVTVPGGGITFVNTAGQLYIGSDGSLFTNAYLDEWALYPTALSPARVLAHYEAATAAGPVIVTPSVGAITFTGLVPKTREFTKPSIGQVIFSGQTGMLRHRAAPPVATLTFSGIAPVFYRRAMPPVGIITFSGLAADATVFVPPIPQINTARSPMVWAR